MNTIDDIDTPNSLDDSQASTSRESVELDQAVIRQDFEDGLRLDLNLGVAAYPVFLTSKPAALLARYLEGLIGCQTAERQALRLNSPKHIILLCDENTAELFGIEVETQLITAGWKVDALTVPAGEGAKTLATAEQICEALAALGATRDTVLCSLGGGIISDLAGFVAGIYKRGMHLAHISTSLVGLVDASVGGKTAVNLPTGKNLIGLYKHPLAIVSDPYFVQQLSEEDYVCGLAEAAKTAILAGEEFTAWMEQSADALLQRDPDTLRELIARCISFKASIVATDPTEDNEPSARLSLNYGHTLGHVIETVTAHYAALAEHSETLDATTHATVPAAIPHGVAIAQGMRFEARIAMQFVEASADFVLRQDALLDALRLPALDSSIMGEDLSLIAETFYRDKKVTDNDLRFILLANPGAPEIVTVPREALLDHLRAWLNMPLKKSSASIVGADSEVQNEVQSEPQSEARKNELPTKSAKQENEL